MNDYTKPIYAVDGKEFKTVNGLCKYLTKKHAATEVSCFDSQRTIRLYRERGSPAVAAYVSTKPEIGKPMTLTAA